MPRTLRQYLDLVVFNLRMNRQATGVVTFINVAFVLGLVFGFSFIIPDVGETTARYLVTGAATQMVVTVGLVVLPQQFAFLKQDGRLDYFLTLPISRELFLLSHLTVVLFQALPAIIVAVVVGAWHFGFRPEVDPAVLLVIPLSVVALAGLGIAIALLSPHLQLTNSLTQLAIFYVLFFAPVLLPRDQLPAALRVISDFLPPSYAADAMRATLTDLPGTHLARSLLVLTGFGALSFAVSATVLRRRQ